MKVPLEKAVIRETTLEDMENYCEMQNKIIRESLLKQNSNQITQN